MTLLKVHSQSIYYFPKCHEKIFCLRTLYSNSFLLQCHSTVAHIFMSDHFILMMIQHINLKTSLWYNILRIKSHKWLIFQAFVESAKTILNPNHFEFKVLISIWIFDVKWKKKQVHLNSFLLTKSPCFIVVTENKLSVEISSWGLHVVTYMKI